MTALANPQLSAHTADNHRVAASTLTRASNNKFRIIKSATGTTTRECTGSDGGCNGGTW